MSEYNYSILNDFNNVISSTCLTSEIENSSISTTLTSILIIDDNVSIKFISSLSPTDETTLNNIVSTHNPNCLIPIINDDIPGLGVAGTKITFWGSGSIYNKWLKQDNHHTKESGGLSNNKSEPYIFPFDARINTLTFINEKINADTDIEIYKNNILQETVIIRNKKWISKSDILSISFSAGDRLSIFIKKFEGGEKPKDVIIHLYCRFTSDLSQEIGDTVL